MSINEEIVITFKQDSNNWELTGDILDLADSDDTSVFLQMFEEYHHEKDTISKELYKTAPLKVDSFFEKLLKRASTNKELGHLIFRISKIDGKKCAAKFIFISPLIYHISEISKGNTTDLICIDNSSITFNVKR